MKLYFRLSVLIAVFLVAPISANAMFSRIVKEFGETAWRSRLKAVNLQRYLSNAHDSDLPYKVKRERLLGPAEYEIVRTTYTRIDVVSSLDENAINSYNELAKKESNVLKKPVPPYVFSLKNLSSLRDAD